MANSEPAAPVEIDEPVVKIFKVRPVPILDKARAAPPSPDETTDMEDTDTASSGASPEALDVQRTNLGQTAAKDGAGATAFAGKLSQSFAESRAGTADDALEAQIASDEARSSPLGEKVAMLGAADAVRAAPALVRALTPR